MDNVFLAVDWHLNMGNVMFGRQLILLHLGLFLPTSEIFMVHHLVIEAILFTNLANCEMFDFKM